jgi:hypothetical protein
MEGATSLHGAFALVPTVVVERATTAASAWGQACVGCDLTRCDGALGGTVARIPLDVSGWRSSRFGRIRFPSGPQRQPQS